MNHPEATIVGERGVQKAPRKTLLRYQLHKDQELFDKAYGLDNPVKYTDPSGHYTYEGGSCAVGSDDCDPTASSYTGRLFQNVLGSDGQLYDTGPYGVDIKTRFLSPAEAFKYYGVAMPMRVRESTVVDPTGEGLRAILIAWGLGLGLSGSRMPNWFPWSSPTSIEGNPIASDVIRESYVADGSKNIVSQAIASQQKTPLDILMPGGDPIGEPGRSAGVRQLPGGEAEMKRVFQDLTVMGELASATYPGVKYNLPGGGAVGLRLSRDWGWTIDIMGVLGVTYTKIHLP